MVITSRQNETVKRLRSLADKKGRRLCGSYLAEGKKLTREALELGLPVRCVCAAEDADFPELPPECAAERVIVSRSVYESISCARSPEGIAAEIALPSYGVRPPEGDSLFLDGVSDPGNLGTLLRTAAAAGYRDVYLADCADAYAPKAVRAAMGGLFRTRPMAGSREEILAALAGTEIVAADMRGEDAFGFRPRGKICLAVGNEANGLSQKTRSAAGAFVRIPMEGETESLNAAVSGSILMYLLKNNR